MGWIGFAIGVMVGAFTVAVCFDVVYARPRRKPKELRIEPSGIVKEVGPLAKKASEPAPESVRKVLSNTLYGRK